MENFGQRLRRLRGQRSQKEVATEMGLPQTTLSTLENQDTIPRGEVLQKLAEYYKVPIDYFYKSHSGETKASDSAKAWLRQLREPIKGKTTIAAQSGVPLDETVREKIAERIRQKYAETSSE